MLEEKNINLKNIRIFLTSHLKCLNSWILMLPKYRNLYDNKTVVEIFS